VWLSHRRVEKKSPREKFGERLRELRLKRGISQEKLAEIAGLPQLLRRLPAAFQLLMLLPGRGVRLRQLADFGLGTVSTVQLTALGVAVFIAIHVDAPAVIKLDRPLVEFLGFLEYGLLACVNTLKQNLLAALKFEMFMFCLIGLTELCRLNCRSAIEVAFLLLLIVLRADGEDTGKLARPKVGQGNIEQLVVRQDLWHAVELLVQS
jgi:transcriptional regulator with XRE-family HTH domain